ncbi:MAG: hypothetical protein ABIR47_08245 [Candidatus Kapaibacterium sp.]
MKKCLYTIIVVIASLCAAPKVHAQLRDSLRMVDSLRMADSLSSDSTRLADADWRVGFDLGGTLGSGGFGVFRTQARGYLVYQFHYPFQAEFGVGIARISGHETDNRWAVGDTTINNQYESRLIPIDLRVAFAPVIGETFNPFVYLGLGVTEFENSAPEARVGTESQSGWALTLPIGLGFLYKPKSFPTFAYHLSLGYNLMFSDRVNGVQQGGSDSYIGATAGFEFLLNVGPNDSDNDGLTNAAENRLGTNPNNPDTDGDGLTDAEEVNIYHTDPLKADTDNDGLSDGKEIRTTRTNPMISDTDGDGVRDGDDACPLAVGEASNKGCPTEDSNR